MRTANLKMRAKSVRVNRTRKREIKMKNSRNLILKDDVPQQYTLRSTAIALPVQPVIMPPSGQSSVTANGGKCFHGVYIPSQYLYTGQAPDCSECHPYEVIAKEHASFKA